MKYGEAVYIGIEPKYFDMERIPRDGDVSNGSPDIDATFDMVAHWKRVELGEDSSDTEFKRKQGDGVARIFRDYARQYHPVVVSGKGIRRDKPDKYQFVQQHDTVNDAAVTFLGLVDTLVQHAIDLGRSMAQRLQ